MYIFDEDSANEVAAEERHYQKTIAKQKNAILSLSNEKVKQQLWRKYFYTPPLPETNEVY